MEEMYLNCFPKIFGVILVLKGICSDQHDIESHAAWPDISHLKQCRIINMLFQKWIKFYICWVQLKYSKSTSFQTSIIRIIRTAKQQTWDEQVFSYKEKLKNFVCSLLSHRHAHSDTQKTSDAMFQKGEVKIQHKSKLDATNSNETIQCARKNILPFHHTPA